MRTKRLLSSFLMAAGIVLVFYGFTAALGFTIVGMFASLAAISSLLYAGGVLFGQAAGAYRESEAPVRSTERSARRSTNSSRSS